MRDKVRLLLNGEPVEIHAPPPTRTVLDWLRYDRRLTGAKEGCAEGDCGACTVAVVETNGVIRAVNSCILFVPMLDGCRLTTVEGVRAKDGGLHPVQRAMIAEHGSQCGFCTPGIVMSLYAHHAMRRPVDRASACDALAGNLCRCTGYGPILAAAEKAAGEAPARIVAPKWPDEAPLGYTSHQGGGQSFYAPTTLDDLARLCAAHPEATLLAGATDIGLWVTKQSRQLNHLISLARVAELQAVTKVGDVLEIGAAVRYTDAEAALAKLHPAFKDYLRRFGALPVRNSGTVVGNIANGSPIGDMPPALIALGASIRLRKNKRTRELPLEKFYLDYGRQDRASGEIITHVMIPKPPRGALFAVEKISKRFEQDISVVSAGMSVRLARGAVIEARLAFGGMAGVPKRAACAEAQLIGQPWSEATIRLAMEALHQDFSPLSDWRGSADYRLKTARNLLLRFFLETIRAGATRVLAQGSLGHG